MRVHVQLAPTSDTPAKNKAGKKKNALEAAERKRWRVYLRTGSQWVRDGEGHGGLCVFVLSVWIREGEQRV